MKTDWWLNVIRRDRSPLPELCVWVWSTTCFIKFRSMTWQSMTLSKQEKTFIEKSFSALSLLLFLEDEPLDLKSYVSSCESSGSEEKVHNQITFDWLFIISSKRYIWGIRKNEKQIHVPNTVVHSHPSVLLHDFSFGDSRSTDPINLEGNVFPTLLLNEKWWKTWQWALHVFNIMFEICTAWCDW